MEMMGQVGPSGPMRRAPRSPGWIGGLLLYGHALLAMSFVSGCAPSTTPVAELGGELQPIPFGIDRVDSPRGGYSIHVEGAVLTYDRTYLEEREAEIGIVDPGEDVGLFSFVHEDSSRGIDDLVVARKKAVNELGGFRFLSEERFFLSTGRYRAASLSLFEGGRAGQPTFVASLFCDSERGTIEVYGWTTRVGTLEALRQAVLGLRLDGE
ncbi:MAG: hypothetical protein R3F16_05460 [Myxococcota bacterium]